MSTLTKHPTVVNYLKNSAIRTKVAEPGKLDTRQLKTLCMEMGADDAGFVEIGRKEIADQKSDILADVPYTKSIIILASKINRASLRTSAHSVADTEYHMSVHQVKHVARKIVTALEKKSVKAVSVSGLFPTEMNRLAAKSFYVISLKPVAVAAGLGWMGTHRMVIHPKFGATIYLSAILIDRELTAYDKPIDHNPCLECQLCVAACPTGAIATDGHYSFPSCMTHNYREKVGGFSDWVENIVESKNARDYRQRVSDHETVSMWQSLGYGPNTKCDYCMAVCPAGEDAIGPFLQDRKSYLKEVVKPLQGKKENVYVVPGSDAQTYVLKRFPHKKARPASNGLRPVSIKDFIKVVPLSFQRHQSAGLNARFHFTFTGDEKEKITITIREKRIELEKGHHGEPDIHVTADSRTWIRFLRKEKSMVWALVSRKIKIKGSARLLLAFGKCFPS